MHETGEASNLIEEELRLPRPAEAGLAMTIRNNFHRSHFLSL